ncbi:Enoyl-CoA hydratase/carnithine racemase [Tistlia consotensis]|uniref:Enoyl-CoA hydratase/carnithine racemase n=1 Tax=Tistlia consotensis USBA 355 TaxID=560819 RepID=A0A1Y6BF67_9PROT|nr:enoyl-CoA hydratase-related protein [Tistlia consotensis]SMF04577.1 Enoyl-CoA hydratase/carnithine racemase [Tistlia consotensis USBA 355]SNR54599.1 Enoyl-CoA hydratase/carnithine racemase [Tistlia consotensis]
MGDPVRTELNGQVLTIAIDRPERRNAINEAVVAGILAGLDAAEADPGVRAVVLTGSGDKAFCAGGDLQPDATGAPFSLDPADPRHYVAALLRRMDGYRLPLVARVNGHALAGGFGLVCACDLVVAREDALLGVSEVKVGLFPMMILPFLLRALPYRQVMELCLTGEPITAREAAEAKIVNYAVPAAELDAKLDWLLGRIVDKSPSGIRLGKQALAKVREMSLDGALEYAQFMLANMARTADAREGFAAFKERRAPLWTGE